MDILGVIPARYGSTRFPGKPLVQILGKPLLAWVIEGARTSKKLSRIIVATDDARIAAVAEHYGAEFVMTPSELPTGTDRIWSAAQNQKADIVVNIQGDEPLIQGSVLDALVAPMITDAELQMATLGRALDSEALNSKNTAKIVLNQRSEAVYFSRWPIPYSREGFEGPRSDVLKHIGVYAYRKSFLEKFCAQTPVESERAEGLEQLRALYLGARIRVIEVSSDSWGVDTPEDVVKIERLLRERRT